MNKKWIALQGSPTNSATMDAQSTEGDGLSSLINTLDTVSVGLKVRDQNSLTLLSRVFIQSLGEVIKEKYPLHILDLLSQKSFKEKRYDLYNNLEYLRLFSILTLYKRDSPDLERLTQTQRIFLEFHQQTDPSLFSATHCGLVIELDPERLACLARKQQNLDVPFFIVPNHGTSLMTALRFGDDYVEAVLEGTLNIDATNRNDETALMIAAEISEPRTIQRLLDRGATCKSYSKDNLTPLFFSILNPNKMVYLTLLRSIEKDERPIAHSMDKRNRLDFINLVLIHQREDLFELVVRLNIYLETEIRKAVDGYLSSEQSIPVELSRRCLSDKQKQMENPFTGMLHDYIDSLGMSVR